MKTIIFDFDGTIANSGAAFVEILEEITHRKQKLTQNEMEDLRMLPLKKVLKYLKIRKWQIPRLIVEGRKGMALRMADIKPSNGLAQVLKELHKDGYEMFILSTNSGKNISRFLKANKLEHLFVQIYGDVGLRSKSSALKRLMKKENIFKNDCIYIGDEVRDVEAAKKAKIKIVSVGWGYSHPAILKKSHPTALATSPQELITILKTF